ncbi:MAG: hypothetical protein A2289_09490 [Deltaproteobacteria bacterium RIFOXYA12_FULL_58_15]|nr:MAG: hypothetical protein A2289_09490 [Deltaproteobacteria bacterium RIFOXYA12_FULL_58_15]
MLRLQWLMLSVCVLMFTACVVAVPDPDDGVFACENADDCRSGYVCRELVCVKEDGSRGKCDTDGCPTGEVCVEFSGGEIGCVDDCGSGCDNDHACAEVSGYQNGQNTMLAACVECPGGCDSTKQCELTGQDHTNYDAIERSCMPLTTDCRNSGCPIAQDVCARTQNDNTVCLPECFAINDTNQCNNAEICTEVYAYSNGNQVNRLACAPCLDGCSTQAQCQNHSGFPNYFDTMTLECVFPDQDCNTAANPCTGGTECVYTNSGGTICLFGCPSFTECGNQDACVEANGWRADNPNLSLAVCAPCPEACGPSDLCVSSDATAPTNFENHAFACEPLVGQCTSDNDCASQGGGLCVSIDNLNNGACVKACSECGSNESEGCVELNAPIGGVRAVCLPCPSQCALNNGTVCAADSWNAETLNNVSMQCVCDVNECHNDLGDSAYCTGDPPYCTAGSSTCMADPTGTCTAPYVCDVFADNCFADCNVSGVPCNSSYGDQCAYRQIYDGSMANLCVSDPCNSSCANDCLAAPYTGEAFCMTNSDECGGSQWCVDHAAGKNTCVWSGWLDGMGNCRTPCSGPGTCGSDICATLAERDRKLPTQVCMPPPTCSPACYLHQTCVYGDEAFISTACTWGCLNNNDCNTTEVCIIDTDRFPGNVDAAPIGTCVANNTCTSVGTDCSGGVETCEWVTAADNRTQTMLLCRPKPSMGARTGQSCDTQACATELGCIRHPSTNSHECRPYCDIANPKCPPGESCVESLRWDGTNYMGTTSACIPTDARYDLGEVGWTSWLGSITGVEGTWNNWSGGVDIVSMDGATGTGAGGGVLVLNDGTMFALYHTGTGEVCGWWPGTAHIGEAEYDQAYSMRRQRVLVECPPYANSNPLCVPDQPHPHLASGLMSDWDGCAFVSSSVVQHSWTDAFSPRGAIDDGLLAAVSVYRNAANSSERQSVRIARFVDMPERNYLSWAPFEAWVEPNRVVNELAVSADLVAWIASEQGNPSNQALHYIPTHAFFTGFDQAAVGVALFSGQIRDLDVDGNFMAWARQDGVTQYIHYASVKIENFSSTALNDDAISACTGCGLLSDSDKVMRAQPSLGSYYLAWNEPDTSTGMIRVRDLLHSTATDAQYSFVGARFGSPVIFKNPWSNNIRIWGFRVGDKTVMDFEFNY